MTTVYTIGYEGASLDGLIATLSLAEVEHVLDVRERAQSRRKGFSKNALAEALRAQGISYSHCKQLGDPKPGREAARRGEVGLFLSIFEAHLALPATIEALSETAVAVQHSKTALLCFERDPKGCHRTLVAKRLSELCSLSVRHLGVVEHADQRGRITAKAA